MAHRLAWGETFSQAVGHLPQRSATSGVRSPRRDLRIATWKAGCQPGPDTGNTAPQPGKSGLFPITGWCLACRQVGQPVWTGLRVNPELPAVAPVHGEIVTDGKLNHYRILYFEQAGSTVVGQFGAAPDSGRTTQA